MDVKAFNQPRPDYISKVTFSDQVFADTLLRLIPNFIRPNHLTVLRFILIPFVLYFILEGQNFAALVAFVLATLSDALDGAMARTRDQITDWGIIFDPFADKLLIGLTGLIVISKLLSPYLAGTIVFLELMLILFSYFRFKGEAVPAKTAGKIKMVLQSFGISFLMLYLVLPADFLLTLSTYTLYGAIVAALLSLFVYRSI